MAVFIPMAFTIYLPFTDWNGVSVPRFIGLSNFAEAFQDSVVGQAFWNNVEWCAFWLTIPLGLAFILASLLVKVRRGQTLYQAIYFSTSIITVTVAGQIWLWIYDPFSGLNSYLQQWGLGFLSLPGLTIPSLALLSVLFAAMWGGFGGNVIWLLAAMTQMDQALEEAATLDGANWLRLVWHVRLPQLRPTIVILCMLTVLGAFQAFDMVFVMTNGGPSHATETLSTYIYRLSTINFRAGYASAIAIFQFFIAVIVIVGYAILRKTQDWEV
jgi:ABC-type sugar transport system permease subunit